MMETPTKKNAKKVLWIAAEVAALLAVPFALMLSACHESTSQSLILVVCVAALVVFFLDFDATKPPLKLVLPTVVLASVAAAGRILFAALPSFKPVTAITIIAGVLFGRRSGFMVGALAALLSNFVFGQGIWTPWQMYAWGMCGYFAGLLAQAGVFGDPLQRPRRALLCLYGAVASLGFGVVMNVYYVVAFTAETTLATLAAACVASVLMDAVHALATVTFLWVLYLPWARKIARIRKKFDLL